MVLIDRNKLIFLLKIFFAPNTSVGRAVRYAWLLILKRNFAAKEISRFQGLPASIG
jgi:hypothetical protein